MESLQHSPFGMRIPGLMRSLCGVSVVGAMIGGLFAMTAAEAPPLPVPGSAPAKPPGAVRSNVRTGSVATIQPAATPGTSPQIKAVNATAARLPQGGAAPVVTKVDPDALQWDSKQKEVAVKLGENEARFSFAFTNVSKSEVTLQRIQTSCGCTAARLPQEPWLIPPGGRGDISVVMDVRGKMAGKTTKTATVFTSVGQISLMVSSIIPAATAEARSMGDRGRNLQIAKADRQAPLRGECANCHVTPAVGKSGKALFDAACGICHTAEHRASFVPDLAKLTKPTDINYWTSWITYGREGSMMPAFHKTRGGFLDDDQVNSLATYLETEFKIENVLGGGVPKPAALVPGPVAPVPAPAAAPLK